MRLFLLIALLLALDMYTFQAFRLLTNNWSMSWKYTLSAIFWAVSAVAIFYLIAGAMGWTEQWPPALVTYWRAFIFITYLSKLFIAAFLLIDDLRRLFTWAYLAIGGKAGSIPGRGRFLSQVGILVGAIPFATLLYGMIRNPYRYKLYRETVRMPNLPEALEGLKIVQISDIHSGSFTFKEPVRNAVDMINAESPDLVFFTGDIVNDRAEELEPFLDVFDKIRAKNGVFSVLGNHDYGEYVRWPDAASKKANLDRLKGMHAQMGWQLLVNEHRKLQINGAEVAVIGVENYSAKPRFPKYGDLAKACEGCESSPLQLLLSHDPSHWEEEVLTKYQQIAITFSGHTHGMQFGIEIPGFIKWSPIQYMYKQWAGLYQQGAQYLYVNRGLGFLGYPGRVGILPEISVIELAKA